MIIFLNEWALMLWRLLSLKTICCGLLCNVAMSAFFWLLLPWPLLPFFWALNFSTLLLFIWNLSWLKPPLFWVVFLLSEMAELKSNTYLSGVLSSPNKLVMLALLTLETCLFELFYDCLVFPPEESCSWLMMFFLMPWVCMLTSDCSVRCWLG